ncbi:hypothetical protein [Selenomonas bovis]|nr:hypothetical protein [Selenomonas bovis]
MEEALENADDVLNLMLLTMEEKHMDTKLAYTPFDGHYKRMVK